MVLFKTKLTCSEDWWKPCWRRGKEGESEFSLIPEGESEREEGFGRAWAMHQLENSQTKTRRYGTGITSRAVDPDPDLTFQVNPDTDTGTIQSGSRVLMTLKTEEKIKNCNLLMSKLQEKPSVLKREHLALQPTHHYGTY
jgi:hypothetical protein